MKLSLIRNKSSGSALISTMLVVTVLTIIVVAFMQSMMIEQKTARSYAHIYRAQLAAESALAIAIERLNSAATENCVIGLDHTAPEDKQALAVIQLDSGGKLIKNIPIAVSASEAYSEKIHSFEITKTLSRKASFFPIKLRAESLQGLAAFYIQPNTSKEPLLRFPTLPSIPRAFSTTLQEVPLVKPDKAGYSAAQLTAINNFISAHPEGAAKPSWKDLLLTPETLNQFTPTTLEVDQSWGDTKNWSLAQSRLGLKKVNLRKLKYYLDNLSVSQAADNPRAKVVEALLEQTTDLNAEGLWGGGTMEWLINPKNPDRYALAEARQIVADLIDYIDADLHPTTDDVENPKYLGVEGRLESDNTVTGHPYIASLGGGLVFNLSVTGQGKLNSTRDLICWTLVNPWSHETLPFSGTYSVEITIEVQGTASGGTLGSQASAYFGQSDKAKPGVLNERLTEIPPNPPLADGKLKPNTGATFPADPTGLSFADNYSMLNEGKQQPREMSFNDVSFKLKKARLKFTDTDGRTSYVQVIATESSPLTLPMNPKNITLPKVSSSQPVVYNPGTVNRFVYLKNDPRLNFQSDSYTDGNAPSSFSGANPPKCSSPPDITAKKDPQQWDGDQGMATTSEWYATKDASKFFFNRSAPKLTDNPAGKQYDVDPVKGNTEVAVDSIGEIGYLFTGRPWQTLSVVANNSASTRKDFSFLDFIEPGTFVSEVEKKTPPLLEKINGKININTAPDYVLKSLFKDLPGLEESDIDQLIQSIITNRSTNGPMVGSGDFGQISEFALAKTDKFDRELVLRQMANLITTRSNEFTIYAYGESFAHTKAVANANMTAIVGFYHDSSGIRRIKIIRKKWN